MEQSDIMSDRTTRVLRVAGWSTAALLLVAPAIAMRFPDSGVNWTASDFVFAGIAFALVGGLLELAARTSRKVSYRAGVAVAVACGFLQLWITLAVGIIGNENNSANWTYIAMALAALSATAVTIGAPRALSRAMMVLVVLQLGFTSLHLINGHFTIVIDLFFAALWVMSARLFARSARQAEA